MIIHPAQEPNPMTTLNLHPFCTFFPRMTADEYQDLRRDLQLNGQIAPIYTYQGMILDGGNRYQALLELGMEPCFTEYKGDDPLGFVLSANIHRRHLTMAQKTAIVSATINWEVAHPTHGTNLFKHGHDVLLSSTSTESDDDCPFDEPPIPGYRLEDRMALSGASRAYQHKADVVAQQDKDLLGKVIRGEVPLNTAYNAVKPPPKPTKRQQVRDMIARGPQAQEPAEGTQAPNPHAPEIDPEQDPKDAEILRLQDENEELREYLREHQHEVERIGKIVAESEPLQAAEKEIKRLEGLLRIAKEQTGGLMDELAAARKLATRLQAVVKRLEKENKKLNGGEKEEAPKKAPNKATWKEASHESP
jgi:hypothetical protein